ncbi:MAG: hypothetical protein Q7S01_01805 [bacterium]|nr:hypothetical protein [bacterium]
MTTSVVFKIDEKLKRDAMRRAKTEGTTLSAFLKSATRNFVSGHLRYGILSSEEEQSIDKVIAIFDKERRAGKLKKLSSLSDIR